MGLSIDELLRRIGAEKIRIQFLHECVTNARKNKQGVALTFYTQETSVEAFMLDNPDTIGIVCWVPYRDFRNVQESWKNENAE